MVKLSVVIITLNEEDNIRRCIGSVKEVADEVLVVDSFSTDHTQKFAEEEGAKFIQNKFEGHIQQKNFALQKASFDHVLSLDADEALSDEAVAAIKKIKSEQDDFKAYRLNRITNYCGKWIRHCGWYPDKKVRLVNRKFAKWGGVNPHDKLLVDSKTRVIDLGVDILHYSYPTIASHATTANKFSEIAAKQVVQSGRKVYLIQHVILNPVFTFVKKYFFQLGFLDGYYGFVVCVLSTYSSFLKYAKVWQMKK